MRETLSGTGFGREGGWRVPRFSTPHEDIFDDVPSCTCVSGAGGGGVDNEVA